MRGWQVAPVTVTQRVWPTNPIRRFQGAIDALYGLAIGGRDSGRRGEAQSAFNGTRYTGDMPPLQSFGRTYGFSIPAVRVTRSRAGSATGNTASTSTNPLLDLLAAGQ